MILSLLATRFGQGAAMLIAGGLLWSIWLAHHDKKIEARGVEKVVSASKEQGKQANAKNEKVRKSAAAPGALERLRQDSATCDDCNGKPMPGLATPKDKAG